MSVQITNRLTEFRKLLRAAAEEVAPNVTWRAATGPTRYQELNVDEQTFSLIGVVGPVTPENEDFLDELLDSHGMHSIRLALESDRQLASAMDVRVLSTTGARPYPQPDETIYIGAEWKVQALFD